MLEDIFREAYSGIISKLDRAAIDGYDEEKLELVIRHSLSFISLLLLSRGNKFHFATLYHDFFQPSSHILLYSLIRSSLYSIFRNDISSDYRSGDNYCNPLKPFRAHLARLNDETSQKLRCEASDKFRIISISKQMS